jgi:hypothetical protein
MSQRTLARLAAASGFIGVITLVAHFVILGSPPGNTASAAAVLTYLAGHHGALLASAWLDGIGSVLAMAVVYALVHLSAPARALPASLATRLATVVIGLSLITDAALITAAQASAAGHAGPAHAAISLANGIDYVFPLANCVWMPALGLVLARSAVLPRIYGRLVILLGAADFLAGTAALSSSAAATANNFVFIALLAWLLAAAAALAVRRPAGPAPEPELPLAAAPGSAVRAQ